MNDCCKKTIQDFLYAEAKKCQTVAGSTLLLGIKNHLQGSEIVVGISELPELADWLTKEQ